MKASTWSERCASSDARGSSKALTHIPVPANPHGKTTVPHPSSPVALVTGASSGFGLLTAIELARAGHRVFATMRDLGRAQRLDQAAKETGVVVEEVELDVTRQESIDAASAHVLEQTGRIDVLVNNAGFGMGGFFEDLEVVEIREQFETNFFGMVAVTKAVVAGMRKRRHGRIINVSSMGGRIGLPAMTAYCASKWAVEGFSESLRYELRRHNVFVTLVEPGTFMTDVFTRNRREARRAADPSSPNYDAYRRLMRGWEWNFERSKADPREVAEVIVKAAVAQRPRLRYLVGTDAKGAAAIKALIPSRCWETAVNAWVAWLSSRAR